jgi:alcohol dehydrogenase (NADP+)
MDVRGYAAMAAGEDLVPWSFQRRDLGVNDVAIEITHSGICHSDIHLVREEWRSQTFPMVPGHEIIGHVSAVGSAVSRFSVGQRVGVGVYVDSCRECDNCLAGESNYCREGMTPTFAGFERDGVTPTQGGYSTGIVVDENYVVSVPERMDSAAGAPLMCAGITVYAPLQRFGAGPGKRVGVMGLGGLGHLAVRFAKAMGAEVTVFSHSENKRQDAFDLGADHFVFSGDSEQMASLAMSFDILVNSVSAPLDPGPYLALLGLGGVLVFVGLSGQPYPVNAFDVLDQRRMIAGSTIGSVGELQNMLDFAAQHGVEASVEVIPASDINAAYERVVRSDVRYRFVIDASTF